MNELTDIIKNAKENKRSCLCQFCRGTGFFRHDAMMEITVCGRPVGEILEIIHYAMDHGYKPTDGGNRCKSISSSLLFA